MSKSYLVRASRDGDQFHYLWAARRCLRLLTAQFGLVAITIEGTSTSDRTGGEDADEIIDIAEYYGSELPKDASFIRYMQLKHSTLGANQPWSASGLEKTIKGFATKYAALRGLLSPDEIQKKIEFWFISNRSVATSIHEAVEDASRGVTARHPKEYKKLEEFLGLTGDDLAAFCRLIRFDDKQDDCWEQRNLLSQDIAGYLADHDVDAPTQLKELVTRKALSESAANPTITKYDVLRALKTGKNELFPAPCLISQVKNTVPRVQEPELIGKIIASVGAPVIVHAEGGVGKSVFATRIEPGMPTGSVTILYDCFGNGQYRSATGYRHRHKDAFAQIANELASKGLCHPLIPTTNADASAYVRAFAYRLKQGVALIRSKQPNALLCVIVDAGDNAQMAAEEVGEPRSFVRDLLRTELPDGVRLVVLCRTHRREMLDPPLNTVCLELKPFNRVETAAFIRQAFPDATETDVDEFHRLSSQNPRVQSFALAQQLSLSETLRLLGPNPTTVDDTIGQILNDSIAKLRDSIGPIEKGQIDRICAGLAALRPLIPIAVLSAISGVDESAIKSFAYDLGRPLIVTGETIKFYDEPSETWFRERFKPDNNSLIAFIKILRPLAPKSAYIASVLPQLMLEAGQFSDLVGLALSTDALPEGSPLERRDVELQRMQFALKATLREKRYLDAAKLALKAGGEAAGETRQISLLQGNTDLAPLFLGSGGIQEVVSRRTFGSGWIGSHHACEAAMMSGSPDLIGEARSRLRMAIEWLNNWSKLPPDDRERERITDADIAEIAMAHLNIHGVQRCAYSLRSWTPREVTYRVGQIVVRKLIEHGRFATIDELAVAAENDLCLILAITTELETVGRLPVLKAVKRAFRLLSNRKISLTSGDHWNSTSQLGPISSLITAAYRLGICTKDAAMAILARYLPDEPPRGLASRHGGSRFSYLRAYSLRAAFLGKELKLSDLAYPELRKELDEKKSYQDSRDAQEFKEDIGALLPWHTLWGKALLGEVAADQAAVAVDGAREACAKTEKVHYREESHTADEIALLWLEILALTGALNVDAVEKFKNWSESLKRPLYTPTLFKAAKLLGLEPALHKFALDFARKGFVITRDARDQAETKAEGYIDAARSILTVSKSEAEAFFNAAVEVSNKIGDENLDRWGAFLDLADRAERPDRRAPEIAYKFSRCAELAYDYVARDKHFNWEATVNALRGLCPTSSIAILSRWRDREFGSETRILPELVEGLINNGNASPADLISLLGLRLGWARDKILSAAVGSLDANQRKYAVELVYEYMKVEDYSHSTWTEIKEIADKLAITLADLDKRIEYAEREERERRARAKENEYGGYERERPKRDWNGLLDGLDFTNPNDISAANQRYRELEPPFYLEDLFAQIFAHIPAGRESEFVHAFADVAEFGLYDLRHLLEAIPVEWKASPAIRSALADTVKSYARRYCMEISKNRYYQVLPFQLIPELSGVSEKELAEVVLTAVGEIAEFASAGRLFTMVGLLTATLTEDQALEALSFGINLLDPILEDRDGDGPWTESLAPPPDRETAIAGYIWAGLACPEASLRWESSHCVLIACRLGRTKIIEKLVDLAKANQSSPFVDARLPFYGMHARQWLLIAMARAAKDAQPTIAPHFDFLTGAALNGEMHVLMRHYAADGALSLMNAKAVPENDDLRKRLENVNTSPFPLAKKSQDWEVEPDDAKPEEDDRFHFGIDIGPYWYQPLGRCFGVSQNRVEREALNVIRNIFKHGGSSRWDEDERARRGCYRDMGSSHSHGSYPRVDDLTFYRSYHAMMIVAGQLLASKPVRESPYSDEERNTFEDWMRRHLLTRRDGYWLADRRDPTPLEPLAWKEQKDDKSWRWSVMRQDFDRVLLSPDGIYNLWGYWTNVDDRREETVHVSSALVGRSRARALLRALQTAKNPQDFRIPSAGDDSAEFDNGSFRLKGWVSVPNGDRELDELDPWAGKISYPPLRPAGYIVEMLALKPDRERRKWTDATSRVGIWSDLWGHYGEKDDEGSKEKGKRLRVSREFVVQLLATTEMCLIVEVEIGRRHQRRRYDAGDDEDGGFGFMYPNSRMFIVEPDGSYTSL